MSQLRNSQLSILLLYGVRMKAVGSLLENNGDSLDIVLHSLRHDIDLGIYCFVWPDANTTAPFLSGQTLLLDFIVKRVY